MAFVAADITELIGKTPLLRLRGYERAHGLRAALLGKLESFNPAGSVKDRVAWAMLRDAEASGALTPGGVIVEPTSGNTGVGLAAVACVRGYRVILTMPETMSAERRHLLAAYGAQLVLTDGAKGMKGAIEKAEALAAETPGAFMPRQFQNPANPRVHEETTGPEIWEDTGGQVDILVCGVGTGGTLSGTGRYLKAQNPALSVIAVEPAASPVLRGGAPGPHGLQGIGAGFIPDTLDTAMYDEVVGVSDEEAVGTVHELARKDGLLAGISSGAAVWAAGHIAARPQNEDKVIVVILPDTGERYLSGLVTGE